MKNKNAIIVLIILWIPLSIVMYNHSSEESMLMRIIMSIAIGPILYFIAGLISLVISVAMLASDYIFYKLDSKEKEFKDNLQDIMGHLFSGAFGVVIVILYYFTITGQHIFSRIYGGW